MVSLLMIFVFGFGRKCMRIVLGLGKFIVGRLEFRFVVTVVFWIRFLR